MRYGRYGLSYAILRIGIGLVFLWIGIDILRHPELWLGFVPESLPFGIPRDVGLKVNGVFDILLGILLIVRVFPKIVAALAALHIAGVLLTSGIGAVTIRDVGLLAACVALLVWPGESSRRQGGFLNFRRFPAG